MSSMIKVIPIVPPGFVVNGITTTGCRTRRCWGTLGGSCPWALSLAWTLCARAVMPGESHVTKTNNLYLQDCG